MERWPQRHRDTEVLEFVFLRDSVPLWQVLADDRFQPALSEAKGPTTDDEREAA